MICAGETGPGMAGSLHSINLRHYINKIIMKYLYIIVGLLLAAGCTTPAPVTGRPDPNVSTSGTLGSVKATEGPVPEKIPTPSPRDTIKH